MKYTPRDFQSTAMGFIMDTPRGNLWADMGMGKTVSTLSALDALWLIGSRFYPALVIAPLRVARGVWPAEVQKWDHLNGMRVSAIVGGEAARRDALKRPADVYTINFENLPWLVKLVGNDWPFKIVIADESTNLKGFRLRKGGIRAAALSKIASKTGRWINLTGTPATNGLTDLWGQNWFIDHGKRLGLSYTAFEQRWFTRNQYTHQIKPLPHAQEEIIAAMSDVTLSLKSTDYFDVREPFEHIVPVELPLPARKLYRQMEDELAIELEGQEIEALSAAAKSQKLLQIASGAIYDAEHEWKLVHREKLEALQSILNDLAGNPLICAYHFQSDLARIKKQFPFARELHTQKDEDDWNKGKIKLLLLHPDSAGHGLNLQDGGHHIAFFSHWWRLESFLQAIERIGPVRQLQSGYDRLTYIHHIVATDTVDEDVMERRKTKRSVQDLLRAGINRRRAAA